MREALVCAGWGDLAQAVKKALTDTYMCSKPSYSGRRASMLNRNVTATVYDGAD
jgi:hypothetical protein